MRLLWVLAIAAVVVGSLLPGSSPVLGWIGMLHVNDKAEHFLAYAVLASFPAWLYSRSTALGTCGMLFTLGVLLEIVQAAVPGRSCELGDALADLAGVVSGFAVSSVLAVWLRMMRSDASSGSPA